MDAADRANILIEAIEVFINQILYLRDVYPQQIFKKRRAYNAPVYASIFPPLNAYLHNVLRSAKELICGKDNELRRIELVFYVDENSVVERHTFELYDLIRAQGIAEDEFLLQFEEQLRKSLYEMPERMKILNKLPNEAKMTVRLHTSQSGHIQLSNKAHLQDFPWLQHQAQDDTSKPQKQWYILPLTAVQNLGFNIFTEVC